LRSEVAVAVHAATPVTTTLTLRVAVSARKKLRLKRKRSRLRLKNAAVVVSDVEPAKLTVKSTEPAASLGALKRWRWKNEVAG